MNRLLLLVLFCGIGLAGTGQVDALEQAPYSRFLGNTQGANAEISGTVLVSGSPADSVWVSVFKESGPNTLQFIKATQTNSINGNYKIENIEEGTYYLLAQPLSETLIDDFATTYYGDSAVWSHSKACYVQGSVSGKNINLTPIISAFGSETISGSIKFGNDVPGYEEGDPVAQISVFVYNMNNELLAVTSSDDQGIYSFSNIPPVDIKVVLNSPGKKSSSFITNPLTLKNEITFWVTSTRSYGTANALNLSNESESNSTKVYPVPASSFLNVQNENEYSSVKIYSVSGELIERSNIELGLSQLDISSFENGIYILQLNGQEATFTQTIIVE